MIKIELINKDFLDAYAKEYYKPRRYHMHPKFTFSEKTLNRMKDIYIRRENGETFVSIAKDYNVSPSFVSYEHYRARVLLRCIERKYSFYALFREDK